MRSSLLPLAALLGSSLLLSTTAQAQGVDRASYRVRFDATWSNATHPGAYPANAHFSPLVGGTHSDAIELWAPGGIATPGIELMAETGGTSSLLQEVNAAISSGDAGQTITGGGAGSPGFAQATFEITSEHPLVSLVTMIAPSPDWFIGVHGLELFANGQWQDDLVIELFAYDAGTDSGPNFNSGNADTQPQEPIHLITEGPFTGATPLGTFTFTRLWSTLGTGCGINPEGSLEHLSGEPRLGQTVGLGLHAPASDFSAPALSILGLSAQPAPGFPCGLSVPTWSLSNAGGPGELLLGSNIVLQPAPIWVGSQVSTDVSIPNSASLVGVAAYLQGFLVESGGRIGATEGLELLIGS